MDKQLYTEAEHKMERELRDCLSKENMNTNDLDVMYKVLDNLKDIATICAMKEQSDYSERRSYDPYYDGMSERRDSRGRYTREGSYEGSYNSYDGDMSERRYSRDELSSKEKEFIRELMKKQR